MALTSSAPRTNDSFRKNKAPPGYLPAAPGCKFYTRSPAAFIVEREAGAVVAAIATKSPPIASLTPPLMFIGAGTAGVGNNRRRTKADNGARHDAGAIASFCPRRHRRNGCADHHQRSDTGGNESFHMILL